MAKELMKNLNDDLNEIKILEIGSGTGILTNYLISKYQNSQITLIDISEPMIESCRNKFGNRLNYIVSDAENYEFENKFDLIYLNSPGSSVQIELTYNYDADPYNVGNGFSHLGVTVSDLEKMHEICKASPYLTGELKGLSGGTPTYFFVTDPDGYRIEVKREK